MKEGGLEQEHEEVKVDSIVKEGKVDSTVKEGRLTQGSEGGQARRGSLGVVEGSMSEWVDAKALQEDLQSLGFTLCLFKPEMGKEVGRQRAHS